MIAPLRHFVPMTLDVADWKQIEPIVQSLLDRPVGSSAEAARWLADASELCSVIDEFGTRRYIDKSCHTDDPTMQAAFMHFVEQIEPKFKPLFFAMQKKYMDLKHRPQPTTPADEKKFAMLEKKWAADVDLFREANVPVETEINRQVNEYDKICGSMMIDFQGKQFTPQQMARFFEEPDRALREQAWLATAKRRLQDRAAIDAVFEKLLALRQQLAVNAGLKDFRAYTWKSLKRFDYSPEDCLRFGDSIAELCVPAVDELDRQRKDDLKLDRLRPWDLSVDPRNRPPLRPFKEDQIDLFVDKTRQVFDHLSPELGAEFDSLRLNHNLDLGSRKGKQPGGYQSTLEEVRQPFIFMNAAGLQRDVETLLHEGGHAFHALAADEPLLFVRSAPIEFCEVASMSMELLGSEHLGVFYNDADAARAKRTLLEGILRTLPWIATIDLFQHWLYTHPGHSADQRTAHWLTLLDRFGSKADWSGHEAARQALWHRQLHLFGHPFYYVEYAIAQLGALQLWLKSMEDPRRALSNYRTALKLGGTRPLPELFSAAGIRFDFSKQTLRPLVDRVREELARLPR
jgi:oligoendopeptidase F